MVVSAGMERLLTEDELSEVLGVPLMTLRWWRQRERGPEWVKIGRAVRYSADAVQRYIDSNTHTPTVRATLEGKRVSI